MVRSAASNFIALRPLWGAWLALVATPVLWWLAAWVYFAVATSQTNESAWPWAAWLGRQGIEWLPSAAVALLGGLMLAWSVARLTSVESWLRQQQAAQDIDDLRKER